MHYPVIEFVAPYRIYIPDRFFQVKADDGTIRIKAVPLPPIQSIGASQVHGTNIEIIHDIFGFAGRTKFCVVVGQTVDLTDATWKTKLCEQDNKLVDLALRAVNRLLEVYRDRDVNRIGVRSFHVLELVRGDLSDVRLVVVDDDLRVVPEFAISWPGFHSVGFGDAVLRDDSVISSIETYLIQNIPIPIERELLSSARNHLWRNQFSLVPIEANTAFETFAYSALLRVDPNASLPDTSDACTKLKSLQTAISLTAQKNTKGPVIWFDPSLDGWKGLVNPELLQWHNACYSLRNKVIHRGYNSVQQTEAQASLDASINAMSYIDTCISQATA